MRIAIIGGIGSGKSEVLAVAKECGLKCLSADEINAELLESADYIARIADAFPNVVSNGKVDRATLAKTVFESDVERAKLNAIAHPLILDKIKSEKANPLVVEMPLLYEIGAQDLFDEIVLVYAKKEVRVERLINRGMSEQDAISRMNAQASEEHLKGIATKVIDNSCDKDALRKQAKSLFTEICG